jgi:glutaredoxin
MSAESEHAAPATVQVTLLTQDDCGYCEHAKLVLGRLAADYPLEVTETDLASPDGARLAALHGVLFAPGLLLDGQGFGYGRISERKLRRTLAARTTDL